MKITVGDFLKLCDDSKQIVSLYRKNESLTFVHVDYLMANYSLYEDWLNGIIEAWYFDKKELVISVED